jgi:hypothetical protein
MSLRALVARARGAELIAAPIVHVDGSGDPDTPCPVCRAGAFYREPGQGWRCSTCLPPLLPNAEKQAGWAFCGVPS